MALLLLIASQSNEVKAEVEAYGTFECMGIVADLPAGVTHEQIGEVRVELERNGRWQPMQSAVRVGSEPYYASSLFGLTPATNYRCRVSFDDTKGKPLKTETLVGSTRDEVSIPPPLKEIYVSPSGSDASDGTKSSPFATVAHACAVATPGTHILLRGGLYYEGEIALPQKPTAEAPLVIRSAAGETGILNGSDPSLLRSEWSTLAPQVVQHRSNHDARNVSLKRLTDGKIFRAYRMTSLAEVTNATSLFEGKVRSFADLSIQAAYWSDGSTITIRVPEGAVGDYAVSVSRMNHAFSIDDRNHFYIDGITFSHYGAKDYSRSIILNNASDIVIQKCRFHYNNTGIGIKRNCNRVVVQDNVCLDDTADWHFGYTKSAGSLYHSEVETGFVTINGPYSGRGVVIRRNAVRGLFDGFGLAPVPYAGTRTAELDFYDNRIFHVADDFMEIDGYARNYRIFRNDMRESLSGISLAQALDGPVWIVRNRIIDCGIAKATELEAYPGYPFKTNGGHGADVGSGKIFFFHNTASSRDPASHALLVKNASWKKLTLRNNIWIGQSHGFLSWTKDLSPIDWDYDNLYSTKGVLLQFGNRGNVSLNTYYKDLKEVFNGTGWLEHGVSAPPLFYDSPARDFRLSANSPCIDRGVLLPGINDNFNGLAPDIGAVEFTP
ncbi:MAG TPA: hypothetical protein DDZ51_02415 [Planctomycetaceae bacterium]|nr:hypothetical protein [Planctomycetaceae bacterium]